MPKLRCLLFPLLVAPALLHAQGKAAGSPLASTSIETAVERVVRQVAFEDISISPTGEYLAATVPKGERTVLAVLRRSDKTVTALFEMEGKTHVTDFEWASETRLLLTIGQRFDRLERPSPTGEVFALDATGRGAEILAGPRAAQAPSASNIRARDDGGSFVFLVDTLRNDPKNVLVSAYSVTAGSEPQTRAERMDIETGRRRVVARAPVARAEFLADHAGVVRFATGFDSENHSITYYRPDDAADWQQINHEGETGRTVWPVGFSSDNTTAYFSVSHRSGPGAIEAFDVATSERRQILRDPVADPGVIIRDLRDGSPIGVRYLDALPRIAWFDPAHPSARAQRSLEAAFPGHKVTFRSATTDGRLQLVVVSSDRNPGDYYLYDNVAKTVDPLLSSAQWIDPTVMAEMKPITVEARDGATLRGFLTVPRGADPKALPLIVHPHGGPFNIQDVWRYEDEVQMLASQGYAVLQVNFRGSGGFGDSFVDAGARQWGRRMQDDLTDATRWAIAQGIADPSRICMVGSSYGAYASLMGAVREPDLYRCVVGNIGVYDLEMWRRNSDVGETRSGRTYIEEFVGSDDLDAVSPVKQASAIRVPVFLAAGGLDERTPKAHTEAMARALTAAGNPPELVIYPTEGHGYYAPENRRDYYTRLLTFLAKHLAPGD